MLNRTEVHSARESILDSLAVQAVRWWLYCELIRCTYNTLHIDMDTFCSVRNAKDPHSVVEFFQTCCKSVELRESNSWRFHASRIQRYVIGCSHSDVSRQPIVLTFKRREVSKGEDLSIKRGHKLSRNKKKNKQVVELWNFLSVVFLPIIFVSGSLPCRRDRCLGSLEWVRWFCVLFCLQITLFLKLGKFLFWLMSHLKVKIIVLENRIQMIM
jgi:hypothetical protein